MSECSFCRTTDGSHSAECVDTNGQGYRKAGPSKMSDNEKCQNGIDFKYYLDVAENVNSVDCLKGELQDLVFEATAELKALQDKIAELVGLMSGEVLLEGRSGGWQEDSPLDNKILAAIDKARK